MAQELPKDLKSKIRIRENGDFPYDLTNNMDETPVYMDMVPSKTVDIRGKKTIKVRTTKSGRRKTANNHSFMPLQQGNLLPHDNTFKGTTYSQIDNKGTGIRWHYG